MDEICAVICQALNYRSRSPQWPVTMSESSVTIPESRFHAPEMIPVTITGITGHARPEYPTADTVAPVPTIEGAVSPPGAPVVEVPAPEPRPAATWTLTKPKRFQGYTEPLYLLLEAAHIAGQPKPTAREVLGAFAKEQPSQIAKVIEGESLDYYLANSAKTKIANLKAIREVIAAMTGKSQNSPA